MYGAGHGGIEAALLAGSALAASGLAMQTLFRNQGDEFACVALCGELDERGRIILSVFPVMIMAFSSCSSSLTLPTTMKCTKERCGVPSENVDLIAPPAATINMQACCAEMPIYAIFAAQLFGVNYEITDLIVIIIMGCMMNVLPLLLLTLPTIFPTIQALQFDPVWFGVIIVLLTEMAVITPPVGINVFGISSMAKDIPMGAIFRDVWQFFLCIAFLILLLTIFPEIALWLPNKFF